jgi:two-component system, chemotaxis family, protein-glutamate methylesterase/glutaminase
MSDDLIHVLVVDDSAYMRKAMREMLEQSSLIRVIGAAHGVEDALEQAMSLHPDVILLDLIMPGVSGVELIRRQMIQNPLPIVVCSSAEAGGEDYLEAMEAGAVEFVQKPTARALDSIYSIQTGLVDAVLAAATVPRNKLSSSLSMQLVESKPTALEETPLFGRERGRGNKAATRVDAVLIGISTGGPNALSVLLPQLPEDLPVPMVVALHMPPGFTHALADRLNSLSRVNVVESTNNLVLRPGLVVLCRSGMHTTFLRRLDGDVETMVGEKPKDSLYCPSVDHLFESGAQVFGSRILGVVMTGMGNDGTAGSAWIKAAGGRVVAEAESSCIVYGMPRSVVEAGLADRVAGLETLAKVIMEEIYEDTAH